MKSLVAAIILFCSINVCGQECTTTITLGAFGDEQQPIKIRPEDLEVRLEGKRVEITRVEPLNPQRFVIVLDTSSAFGKNYVPDWTYSNTVRFNQNVINWIFLKTVAESLVAKAPSGVGIGVVGVGSGPIATVDIDEDRKVVIDAINDFGHWFIFGEQEAGIRKANELLGAAQEGDFIVSVSDWGVLPSQDLGRDLPGLMIGNSRRLFAVHVLFRYPRDANELYYASESPFDDLTRKTGGLHLETFLAERPEDVAPVANELAAKIIDAAFGYHQLELRGEPSRKPRKLKISAPEAVKQLAYVAELPPCVKRGGAASEFPTKNTNGPATAQPPDLSKYTTYSLSNLEPELAAKVDACLASKGFIRRDPPDFVLSYVLAGEFRNQAPREPSTADSMNDSQVSARVGHQLEMERTPVSPYPNVFGLMIEKDSEPRKTLTVKLVDAKTRKAIWSKEKKIPSNTTLPVDSGYVRSQIVKLLKQLPAKNVR